MKAGAKSVINRQTETGNVQSQRESKPNELENKLSRSEINSSDSLTRSLREEQNNSNQSTRQHYEITSQV